jgi:hypothetical protein
MHVRRDATKLRQPCFLPSPSSTDQPPLPTPARSRLAACPKLWREQCRRRFGVPVPEELGLEEDPAAARPTFWRDLYKYNHR